MLRTCSNGKIQRGQFSVDSESCKLKEFEVVQSWRLRQLYGEALSNEIFASRQNRATELFPPVMNWKRALGCANLPLVRHDSQCMTVKGIRAVEEEADAYRKHHDSYVRRKTRSYVIHGLPRWFVYASDPPVPWSPTQEVSLSLGDRVMCCRSDDGIPFGTRGTIVGIHGGSKRVEVLFDRKVMGGGTLCSRCSDLRGKVVSVALSLTCRSHLYQT